MKDSPLHVGVYHVVHGGSQGITVRTPWVPRGLSGSATNAILLVWPISSSGHLVVAGSGRPEAQAAGWDSNPGSLALKPVPFPLSQAASV